MRWTIRIGMLVGLLVLGRELHVRQSAVTVVAGRIDREREAIDRAEGALEDLDRDIGAATDTLRLLDAEIAAIRRRWPGGVPPSEWPRYRRLVSEREAAADRRARLVADEGRRRAEYERHVAAHNDGVEEATALAHRATPAAIVRDVWRRLTGR